MNTTQKIAKLESELKILKAEQNELEFIKIDYKVMPKAFFVKYGIKPFEIMKRKMKYGDESWNNITFCDAKKETEKLGYRLPDIREMLALLDYYKQKNKKISENDKEFLGIEELSYEEDIFYEWIEGAGCAFVRGGDWDTNCSAGIFTLTLDLNYSPSFLCNTIGFRCAR